MGSLHASGWLSGVRHQPSTHFNARPQERAVSLVVLHNITLPPGKFQTGCVEDFFLGSLDTTQDPALKDLEGVNVSSHFFISRAGAVTQFVSCNDRAWHAGASSFLGLDNCNDFSIGIEIEGTDDAPFEEAQYVALISLLGAIHERYPVTSVVAHSDIAPGRKTDPGPFFDWIRLINDKALFGDPAFPGAAARMALSARNACISVSV